MADNIGNGGIPAKSEPRWERRKDARPQELLSAALDLFVERGFTATRLDDVAARAGVSKGTLYLYFANKQELLKAVVREGIVPFIGQAEKMLDAATGHTMPLFRDFMLGWFRHIGATKLAGISKLVMSEAGNFPELAAFYHEEVIRRNNALIEKLLQRGIDRGEFRPMNVATMRMIVIAPVLMLMMSRHSGGAFNRTPIDPEKYLDTYIDFAMHGLLEDTPAPPSPPAAKKRQRSKS